MKPNNTKVMKPKSSNTLIDITLHDMTLRIFMHSFTL